GLMPAYWQPFDENRPANARIDQILSWLDQPAAQRPTFLTLYFEDTDSAGHANGPDSPEVRDAIVRDDAYIGRLVEGLTRRGLIDRVNLIVVSDHGMTAVDDTRVIGADDFVAPTVVLIPTIIH